MKTVKLGKLLSGKNGRTDESHRIYVVRDGDTVFYVGQTTRPPEDRLHEHRYGRYNYGSPSSNLGEVIEHNEPDSHDWTVELYKPAECEQYARIQADGKTSLSRAEGIIINEYEPHLNGRGDKTSLPERYRDPKFERHYHESVDALDDQ